MYHRSLMPRCLRIALGETIYHVVNRANDSRAMFQDANDYAAFERILIEGQLKHDMRILAYCLMPNSWHLVLYPRRDGDLSRFMHWVTLTHSTRWRVQRHTVGEGHLYQRRFYSYAVETDAHFLMLCRYIERQAMKVGLVRHAEEWRWSSLWRRQSETSVEETPLSDWPVAAPASYLKWVNTTLENEQDWERRITLGMERAIPLGTPAWTSSIAKQLGIPLVVRPRGRPRKFANHSI